MAKITRARYIQRFIAATWGDDLNNAHDFVLNGKIKVHNTTVAGRDTNSIKRWIEDAQAVRAGFPNCKVTVIKEVQQGDWNMALCEFSGTHKGEYLGVPASGKRIRVSGSIATRFEDGVPVETWNHFDVLDLLAKMGRSPV